MAWFFNDTVVGGSLNEEWGAVFNFLFAHIMFWAVGLPTFLDSGFEDTRNGDNSASRARETPPHISASILVPAACRCLMWSNTLATLLPVCPRHQDSVRLFLAHHTSAGAFPLPDPRSLPPSQTPPPPASRAPASSP